MATRPLPGRRSSVVPCGPLPVPCRPTTWQPPRTRSARRLSQSTGAMRTTGERWSRCAASSAPLACSARPTGLRLPDPVASIETRAGPKGTRWKVVWYAAGRKRSKTWHTEARAELWKALIESVNGDEARAAQHLARQASQAMTLQAVADHRLDLLRAYDYTRQTYRSYMRNHIGPALGDWPVDTITEDDCRRFVIGLERKG